MVLILCLRCKPIALWWDKSLPGTCDAIDTTSTETLGLFQGSWMAGSDIALAVYPIFVFWNLNVSWKRKAALCGLMSGGLVAGACGAVKSVQIQLAYSSDDVTYNIYPLLITTLVESWMILILAAIPPLRIIFRKARPHGSASYGTMRPSQDPKSSHRPMPLDDLSHSSQGWSDTRKKMAFEDNESEEGILPSGITVTTDYDVKYEPHGKPRTFD